MSGASNFFPKGVYINLARFSRPEALVRSLELDCPVWTIIVVFFRTENEQFLDVDGERFPYKEMEMTPTDLCLNVIGGSHFYDL